MNGFDFHRMILIIGVSMIPMMIGVQIYNIVDCTKLTQDGYKLWLKDNPGKTFQNYTDSCNYFHPFALYGMIPFAIPLGCVVWSTTRESKSKCS